MEDRLITTKEVGNYRIKIYGDYIQLYTTTKK